MKRLIPLLLLADEQEDISNGDLVRGKMFVPDDDTVKCICMVTDEGSGTLEMKNIAASPLLQCKGYGKAMIGFLLRRYAHPFDGLQAGTGDSPLTISLLQRSTDFTVPTSSPHFFTDHDHHPIFETRCSS